MWELTRENHVSHTCEIFLQNWPDLVVILTSLIHVFDSWIIQAVPAGLVSFGYGTLVRFG